MSGVEIHRKKPVEVEMMLWDGEPETSDAIGAWTGAYDNHGAPFTRWKPPMPSSATMTGLLYVDHNRSNAPIPVGYRVAKEIDGSGFYPLSPEGFAAGYVAPGVSE